MSYYSEKTPLLGAGLARNVMSQFLTQVKSRRGQTSFIERHGINGQWLKPDMPYDIRITKLFKILEVKAHYQTDEEFLDDWKAMGEQFLNLVRTPNNLIKFL